MYCWRDMTFCSQSANLTGDCINGNCYRNFSDEQKAAAYAWLGDKAPIAIANLRNEDCGYEGENDA